jgi:hypothetical protein
MRLVIRAQALTVQRVASWFRCWVLFSFLWLFFWDSNVMDMCSALFSRSMS